MKRNLFIFTIFLILNNRSISQEGFINKNAHGTLIIGAVCKNGIFVFADSKASNPEWDLFNVKKVFATKFCLLAFSGSAYIKETAIWSFVGQIENSTIRSPKLLLDEYLTILENNLGKQVMDSFFRISNTVLMSFGYGDNGQGEMVTYDIKNYQIFHNFISNLGNNIDKNYNDRPIESMIDFYSNRYQKIYDQVEPNLETVGGPPQIYTIERNSNPKCIVGCDFGTWKSDLELDQNIKSKKIVFIRKK